MQAVAELRTQAAVHRRALHRAVARGDLAAMRSALHELYVDEASPLRQMDKPLRRVETYAPIVEAAILARVLAPASAACAEMALNLEHTHVKFGLPPHDYAAIVAQLDRVEATGDDPHGVAWCAGTCLEGKVKPWRHKAAGDVEEASSDSAA